MHQQPHQPALGLPLLAEKEHVVAGEQGDVDLGDHRVVVADDPGKEFLARLEHPQEVGLHLVSDRLALPSGGLEIREGRGAAGVRHGRHGRAPGAGALIVGDRASGGLG